MYEVTYVQGLRSARLYVAYLHLCLRQRPFTGPFKSIQRAHELPSGRGNPRREVVGHAYARYSHPFAEIGLACCRCKDVLQYLNDFFPRLCGRYWSSAYAWSGVTEYTKGGRDAWASIPNSSGPACPAIELEFGPASKGSEHALHGALLRGEVQYLVVELVARL